MTVASLCLALVGKTQANCLLRLFAVTRLVFSENLPCDSDKEFNSGIHTQYERVSSKFITQYSQTWLQFIHMHHSFNILSDDRSKAYSKTMPPRSAIQSFLLQMRVSSPVLKVIH